MAESIISPGVFSRENDISFVQPAAVEAGAAIIGPAVKGPVETPTLVTSYNEYVRKFGTTFTSGSTKHEFLTSVAVKNYFSQGGGSVLVTRVVSGSFTTATDTGIVATKIESGSTVYDAFALETLGKGEIFNNFAGGENSDGSLADGTEDNLRWEVSNINNQRGTFSLSIRRGDDTIKSKVVLETFNNISLDPNTDNYIEKMIGNQSQTLVTGADGTYLRTSGSYVNKSNYVRVSTVNTPTLSYLSTDGITVNTDSDTISYSASLPIASSGSFSGATGTNFASDRPGNYFGSIDNNDTQGLVADNYLNVISLLGNSEEYVFNIISTPGLAYQNASHVTPIDLIVSLAESRGDCIAVLDLTNYGQTVAEAASQATTINSSYAATYWPWVQMRSATGKDEWAPPSAVIPGVYAFTDNYSAPWFAPAGLVKGGIPGIIQAERKLNRTQRDTLYSAKVNPIATFPGQGIAVYGQKTLQTKASALDRVNARRLLIEIKDFIGKEARKLVFEQNTIATRNKFLATVNPYLDSVVQREGLYAYRVVMDDTNNTADVVDRNQLIGQIFIQPAKTAEFILLDFTIEPTGATFAG